MNPEAKNLVIVWEQLGNSSCSKLSRLPRPMLANGPINGLAKSRQTAISKANRKLTEDI